MADDTESAPATLDMTPDEFRRLGYHAVDLMADFLAGLRDRPVAPALSPTEVRDVLGRRSLPETGGDPEALLDEAAELIFGYNRLTGHPRHWGYIIGSAAPIGAFADFLAAGVNTNLASWYSGPMSIEIEVQAVRWIAELLGYPADCGGLLTSGGNMANFIGVIAARRALADGNVRKEGMAGAGRLRAYVSSETHTWVEKAADLFGMGTDAIRWIPTDSGQRMDTAALEARIAEDSARGDKPFLVVGTAGTVATGAVDPLPELAAIARRHKMWFHVDGAYGALAITAPGAPADLAGLREADSIAVDAHKWLYTPLEAGCALVRDRQALRDAFSYRPSYYHHPGTGGDEGGDEAEDEITHYYEYGPQNSRCFRALKVWLVLRHIGRADFSRLVAEDIRRAGLLAECLAAEPDIEVVTRNLSIATFRYVPSGVDAGDDLNRLNTDLLERLQASGEAYLSNAVIDGRFLLRACITNFRTTDDDVRALPEIVRRLGREAAAAIGG